MNLKVKILPMFVDIYRDISTQYAGAIPSLPKPGQENVRAARHISKAPHPECQERYARVRWLCCYKQEAWNRQ